MKTKESICSSTIKGTKTIKSVDMENKEIVYDDNEPPGVDPHLIVPLERYHNNHVKPDCRAYKLLGIYLDKTLSYNYHTNFLFNKLTILHE